MVKTFLEMLAPAVQGPKSSFFCLHRRCKRSKVFFEVCTGGASIIQKENRPGERGMGGLSPGGGSDPKKNPVIPYFSGTASRVATSRRHDFSTEAMPTASSGECGCVMSGPKEIMSMSG